MKSSLSSGLVPKQLLQKLLMVGSVFWVLVVFPKNRYGTDFWLLVLELVHELYIYMQNFLGFKIEKSNLVCYCLHVEFSGL